MKKIQFMAVIFLIILILPAIGMWADLHSRPTGGNGLFCWDEEVLKDTSQRETLWRAMKQYDLRELYQHISSDMTPEELSPFFMDAAAHDVTVYMLTGDPSWALDEDGTDLTAAVRQAASVQKQAGGSVLKGVMADVEPYLLPGWEEHSGELMDSYVSSMKTARKQAEAEDLFLYACIPYYYDTEGLTPYLDDLMEDGCHGIAVMNYYRENEAKHLKYEWQQAKHLQKPVINIYELQRPGVHGLEEISTYHASGMDGVEKSFQKIQEELPYPDLFYAVHDYRALLEVEDIE